MCRQPDYMILLLYFNQQTACGAPVSWSKYTTPLISGPPRINLGAGTPSCITPQQPTINSLNKYV